MRLNPIVATLGTNALLFGVVLWYTAGIPTTTTARLARVGGGTWLGSPAPVYFAVAATALVTAVVKLTPAGRRFEGVGANATAARMAGLPVQRHRAAAYLWAQLLYCLAAILHAGIVNQPTAYEGNNYLLPTVAAVVLGGTSLLGGRGNLVATALAALFLSQLDQFVLALGVSFATRTLVQAAALAVGVALYTVNWGALTRRVTEASSVRASPRHSRDCIANVDKHRIPWTPRKEDRRMTPRRGGALIACALLCIGYSRLQRRRPLGQLPSRRGAARRRSSSGSRTGSAETAGVSSRPLRHATKRRSARA